MYYTSKEITLWVDQSINVKTNLKQNYLVGFGFLFVFYLSYINTSTYFTNTPRVPFPLWNTQQTLTSNLGRLIPAFILLAWLGSVRQVVLIYSSDTILLALDQRRATHIDSTCFIYSFLYILLYYFSIIYSFLRLWYSDSLPHNRIQKHPPSASNRVLECANPERTGFGYVCALAFSYYTFIHCGFFFCKSSIHIVLCNKLATGWKSWKHGSESTCESFVLQHRKHR